jgi:hypothetical protein
MIMSMNSFQELWQLGAGSGPHVPQDGVRERGDGEQGLQDRVDVAGVAEVLQAGRATQTHGYNGGRFFAGYFLGVYCKPNGGVFRR